MSQKHLSRLLSRLQDFKEPKIKLEQYITNSDVASELLWSADMRGFIKGKTIIDLGAGTGGLGIGALLLGAKKVIFLEKDESAIVILKKNIAQVSEEYELPDYEIVQGDVSEAKGEYDMVVMNPPFGTKIKRVDTLFLQKAFTLSDVVLTIHKTSTKTYILKTIEENGFSLIESFDFNYLLKKTFEHHLKQVKTIEVSGFIVNKVN